MHRQGRDVCKPFLVAKRPEDQCDFAQEIKSDIEDAIAKYNEATSRLAEAEKNKAQADQVWDEWKSTGEGGVW